MAIIDEYLKENPNSSIDLGFALERSYVAVLKDANGKVVCSAGSSQNIASALEQLCVALKLSGRG